MQNARRRRFVTYFTGKPFLGDRAKLIAKTGLTKGRVAQLFDDDQAFGERAAQALAGRLGLPPDFFEHDQAGDAPPLPPPDFSDRRAASESGWSVLEDLAAMPVAERDALVADIHGRAEGYRAYLREAMQRMSGAAPAAEAATEPAESNVSALPERSETAHRVRVGPGIKKAMQAIEDKRRSRK